MSASGHLAIFSPPFRLTLAVVMTAVCPAAADEAAPTALYIGAFAGEDAEIRAAGLLARLLPPVLDAEIDHVSELGSAWEVDGSGQVLLTDRRALERRDRTAEEALAFGSVLLASLAAQGRAPDHLVVLGNVEAVLQWDGTAVVQATLAEPAPEASPEVKKLRTGGAVFTGVGLGITLGGSALAALGQQTAADAQSAAEYEGPDGTVYLDPAKWTIYEDDFEAGRSLNRGGWVMVAAGSAATVTGLILLARGAHLHRLENAPVPAVAVTPDGAFLSLSGRF